MVDIWLVDYKFDLFFDRSRIFAMATNFGVKIGEIAAYSPLVVALAFENGLQYRTSDFKGFI